MLSNLIFPFEKIPLWIMSFKILFFSQLSFKVFRNDADWILDISCSFWISSGENMLTTRNSETPSFISSCQIDCSLTTKVFTISGNNFPISLLSIQPSLFNVTLTRLKVFAIEKRKEFSYFNVYFLNGSKVNFMHR